MNMPLWIGFDLDFFLWTLAWAREPLEYFTPHQPSYLRGRITWPVEGWNEEWKNDWGRYLKKVTMWSNQYIKSEYRRSVELASERAQGCSVCIRASNLPADSDAPPPKNMMRNPPRFLPKTGHMVSLHLLPRLAAGANYRHSFCLLFRKSCR